MFARCDNSVGAGVNASAEGLKDDEGDIAGAKEGADGSNLLGDSRGGLWVEGENVAADGLRVDGSVPSRMD